MTSRVGKEGIIIQFDTKKLGKRIKSIRINKNISQDTMAEKILVDRTLISKIENGESVPSLETLIYIANALDVSANDLLIDSLDVTDDRTADIILRGCSPEEQYILTENMAALKSILKEYSIRK